MRKYCNNSNSLTVLELYDGGAMFIGSYVLQILLQFVFSFVLITTDVGVDFTSSTLGICILSVINEFSMFITPFLYSKIKGEKLYVGVGLNKRLGIKRTGLALGLAIATVMAFAPLANAFVALIIKSGYDTSSMTSLAINSWGTYVVGIIFLCALPAVCEEFLYRGMISRALGDKGMIFGILMSSLLFALMHGSPIQLVHQFFLGCVCAIIYYSSRNLRACMIVHFTNNFIAITGNFILFKTGKIDFALNWWQSLIVTVVGLAMLAVAIVAYYKLSNPRRAIDVKDIEGGLKEGFYTQAENQAFESERQAIIEQAEQCSSDEEREILFEAKADEKKKLNKKGRLAMIYALILAIGVWVINTVTNYLS